MDVFIKKVRSIMLLLFIAVMTLTVLTIYWPNYVRLRNSLDETFAISGYSKQLMMEQYIENSLDIAIALSTRNDIREALVEYQSGAIDMAELSRRSQSAFLSGIRPFDQIIHAARRAADETVIEYGLMPEGLSTTAAVNTSPVQFLRQSANGWYLIVLSPVLHNQSVLAVDTLTFSLDSILEQMNRDRLDVQLISTDQLTRQYDFDLTGLADGAVTASDDEVLFAILADENDTSLLIRHRRDLLYRPLITSILTNLVTLSLIFFLIIAFTNLVLKRYRRELVLYMQKIIERQQEELQAARIDELTRVYNRRSGFDRIQQSIRRAKLRNEAICLIFVDVNGLKDVNDHLGHESGDELLQTVAKGIRRHIRYDDYVARFGGDEFVVILHRTTRTDAEQVWQRTQVYFDQINQDGSRPYIISVSHGVVEIRDSDDTTVDYYLKLADEAMYREKKEIKRNMPSVLRNTEESPI